MSNLRKFIAVFLVFGVFFAPLRPVYAAKAIKLAIVRWKAEPDAVKYLFTIVDNKEQIVFQKETTDTEAEVPLGPGRYRYRNQSIDKDGIFGPIGEPIDFEIKEKMENQSIVRYVIFIEPGVQNSSRFNMNLGIGATFMAYQEIPGINGSPSLKFSQLGFTGKFTFAYQVIQEKLDVGVIGYGTLIPVLTGAEPSDLPPARFFGINFRAGYRIPYERTPYAFSVALGAYAWGMNVPTDPTTGYPAYGLALLLGPQIFISARSKFQGPGGHVFYVKYAPLSDTFEVNFIKSEFAVGGAVVLPPMLNIKRALSATLDISNLYYESSVYANRISFQTVSLGVQMAF